MKRILRIVAINFALLSSLVVILFLLVPIGSYYIERLVENARQAGDLPNYEQADWAIRHFQEIEQLSTRYRSFVGWRREPFLGETIVVEGYYGERRTPLPANAARPSVYFFGGSAVWGTGARDEETIPALYAAATGRIARNFGESGYIAHQNLEMLLWLLQSGERPDVVVFYDGVNDILQKCRHNHNLFAHGQEGFIAGRARAKPGSLGYYLLPVLRLLPDWGEDDDPDRGSTCDGDPAKAKAVAESILNDWETARLVAEAHGIRFYAVLQPVSYFSQTRLDHLMQKLRSPDRRRQYETVYPLIRAELDARGFADFTAVLDRDEYIYIDFVHVSPNGNALIAQALAELVD
jgi:lysophospholipase L1-like esterase